MIVGGGPGPASIGRGPAYPGTAAAKAGIQAGDVLHSINGYSTQQYGILTWILAHAPPNHVLEIHLRSVIDGREHTLTARINGSGRGLATWCRAPRPGGFSGSRS